MALGRAEDMDGLTPAENDHAPCAILTAGLYRFSGVLTIHPAEQDESQYR